MMPATHGCKWLTMRSLKPNCMRMLWPHSSGICPHHPLQGFMDSFNNFSILSWNIRGASSREARRHVRDLVKSHQPSLFCVCETHVPFSRVEKLWASLGYKPLFLQEARGHSGGLWVLSNSTATTFTLVDSMQQAITFSVSRRNDSWHAPSYMLPLLLLTVAGSEIIFPSYVVSYMALGFSLVISMKFFTPLRFRVAPLMLDMRHFLLNFCSTATFWIFTLLGDYSLGVTMSVVWAMFAKNLTVLLLMLIGNLLSPMQSWKSSLNILQTTTHFS